MIEQARWYTGCLPETGLAILEKAAARQLRRGEILTKVGDRIEQLTLIVVGVLEVSCTASPGKRHIAGYVTQGDLYNIVPFMDKVPVTHDTIAITDVFTLQLGSPLATTLMSQDGAFTSALIVLLSQRSRHTYLTLADSALLPLRRRLARAASCPISVDWGIGPQIAVLLKSGERRLHGQIRRIEAASQYDLITSQPQLTHPFVP